MGNGKEQQKSLAANKFSLNFKMPPEPEGERGRLFVTRLAGGTIQLPGFRCDIGRNCGSAA